MRQDGNHGWNQRGLEGQPGVARTRLKVKISCDLLLATSVFFQRPSPFNSQTVLMLFFVLAIIILFVTAFPPTGEGPCYYIDGRIEQSGSACYYLNSVGASMCCASHEDCLPSGLCTGAPNGPVGPNEDNKAIWRRSCSDYTWQDGACLAIAPCKCRIC